MKHGFIYPGGDALDAASVVVTGVQAVIKIDTEMTIHQTIFLSTELKKLTVENNIRTSPFYIVLPPSVRNLTLFSLYAIFPNQKIKR